MKRQRLDCMVRVTAFVIGFISVAVLLTAILLERPGLRVAYFSKIDAAGAQFRHVFLGARLGRTDRKFYIDPDHEPQILTSLYPGYDPQALWNDKNLWQNYFFRDFDTKVTSAAYSAQSDYGIVVYQSLTGCFDIVRRFGADIIVMGASDLAQAVPPDELATHFPKKKILMCAAPTFTLDTALTSLDLISQLYPKEFARPQMVLVGVSRTMAYLASPFYPALNATKLELIHRYKQADFLGSYAFLNQTFRIPWTWNVIYPIRRDANHLPLINRIAHPERWSILDLQVSPEDLARNPRAFDLARENNRQGSSIFLGSEREKTCERLSRLPELLLAVRNRALQVADRAVVFTTPTMGDELKFAPQCYLEIYDQSIRALRNEQTLAINESMSGYGMNIGDFAFRDSWKTGGLLTFDVAHPNIFGARKFTAFLSSAIKERFEP